MRVVNGKVPQKMATQQPPAKESAETMNTLESPDEGRKEGMREIVRGDKYKNPADARSIAVTSEEIVII